MTFRIICLAVAFCSLISCKTSEEDIVNSSDSQVSLQKDAHIINKNANGIDVSATFRPADIMAKMEIQSREISNDAVQDSIFDKYRDNIYFVLSYSKEGKELLSGISIDRSTFNHVQNTLTSAMSDYVHLITTNNDTIPMIDANFSRTYGMSRSNNILLVFEKNEKAQKAKELILTVNDIGIGTGDLKFRYPGTILKTSIF